MRAPDVAKAILPSSLVFFAFLLCAFAPLRELNSRNYLNSHLLTNSRRDFADLVHQVGVLLGQ
jgi:hypothetical protein